MRADRKRRAAGRIVRVLREAGHVAYFAGGCVRDMLLGRPPKDYDVATDARPEQVAGLLHNTRHVGEAFGVVLARLMGAEIEVATFRQEWGYSDGRRPDRVAFTTAEHDARRRDFTINGLFYDPLDDRVIDYVGGRADLRRRVIRAIGDADERFGEDYLRMLRAVRFSARLGFEIEPDTRAAIGRHAPKLGFISRERIGMEMRMMLEDAHRAEAVEMCGRLALDAPGLDDEHLPIHTPTLRALRPPAVGRGAGAPVADSPDGQAQVHDAEPSADEPAPMLYATALAAWAIDRHLAGEGVGPDAEPAAQRQALDRMNPAVLARRWRGALALSNDDRDLLQGLLANVGQMLDWPRLGIAARKRRMARSDWPAHARLLRAWAAARGWADIHAFEADVQQLQQQGVAPEPLINGDDLIALGLRPGPLFATVLDAVYDAQLEHRIGDRAAALALARKIATQRGDTL